MRIWEIIGYVLTPDNYGRSYFVFQGVPGSGKSTLERLISNMFSYGSVFRIRGDDFGGRFSLQGLEGKAVIIVSDLPGRVFSEDTVSIIKQISGRDCISTDVKYSEQRSFRTNAKMLFFTNNAFIPRSMDYAFNSRAVCVPFRYAVDKSEQDFSLDYKLASEIDAIATKAMMYYFGLRDRQALRIQRRLPAERLRARHRLLRQRRHRHRRFYQRVLLSRPQWMHICKRCI